MRTRLIAALAMAALLAWPASAYEGSYIVQRKASLTASAEAITVQLPAGTMRTVKFDSASVYCSAQCEVTLERDGTVATTTALTPAKLNSSDSAATATAYHTSNAGAGTGIGRQIVGAGQTFIFDLTTVGLKAGETFTLRTDSITATVVINVKWFE